MVSAARAAVELWVVLLCAVCYPLVCRFEQQRQEGSTALQEFCFVRFVRQKALRKGVAQKNQN